MMPAPMHGPIEGISNFRDFGGLATVTGHLIPARRFWRSAHPAGVTRAGIEGLAGLGIETVIDLRGTSERAKALADFGATRIVVRPTPVEPKTSARLRALLDDPETSAERVRMAMIESYRAYATEAAAAFGSALEAVAGAGGRPVLVHCTAGKDRTGFLVAVLQAALGVPQPLIFEEYLATNRHWDRASVSGHLPMTSEAIEPVLVADPDYLAAAFEEIDRHDGSVAAFIHRATAGRVTPAHLETMLERSQTL